MRVANFFRRYKILTVVAVAWITILGGVSAEAAGRWSGEIVADGDVLPDGSTVAVIAPFSPDINKKGDIAFVGLEDGRPNAIFTQHELVVEAGDILPDGNTVAAITSVPSINARGKIAFAGFVDRISGSPNAIFTQDGLVVKVGDALPDGNILAAIFGPPAINARGEVAFLGQIRGEPIAVFTQHGVVVKAGEMLPDGTPVGSIAGQDAVGEGMGSYSACKAPPTLTSLCAARPS
jgi:hypothetical protein